MPHTAALSTGHSGRKAALPRNWMECLKRGRRCHNPEAPSPWLTLLALRRAGVWTSVPVRGQWDERRRNRDTPVSPTIYPSWRYRQDMDGLTKEFHRQNSKL